MTSSKPAFRGALIEPALLAPVNVLALHGAAVVIVDDQETARFALDEMSTAWRGRCAASRSSAYPLRLRGVGILMTVATFRRVSRCSGFKARKASSQMRSSSVNRST
jgi:hypothetical protein